MMKTRSRGRPKKEGGALTAKQRMARQRQRQAIFKAELQQHGLSPQMVYVDNYLFSRLKDIESKHENCTIHDLVFLAMRYYLDYVMPERDIKNYQFNLHRAIHAANQSAIDQGLSGLFSTVRGEFADHDRPETSEN
ncbi:MAG: hypothetical protein JAY72_19440 [Candidatus Thiodiazotropha endolucinida]|nr:hypothetical protein [Candidatus Thiodiazotropha taylori]MCW4323857.1 hypothetical protein [Candidatus Thiodiazotropha taylori]